ncbi:rano class II histocompatibility antigen, A beta chain-like [Heptranchias perlo]|uniref:rano class II histocompatibility antigen, A beta chain-like n=1 Tax=Heptranchias perlo TaxID=212740 RepID=UPI00355A31F6
MLIPAMLHLRNVRTKTAIFPATFCFCCLLSWTSGLDVVQQLLVCDRAAVSLKDVTGCSWSMAYNTNQLSRFDTEKSRFIVENPTVKSEVDSLNKDPKALRNTQNEMQDNINFLSRLLKAGAATLDRKETPSVTINFHDLEIHGQPSQLLCTVTGFYPKALNITWLRNGRSIQHEVVQTDILPNSDGTFQTVAFVNFDPKTKNIYTCYVEHTSIPEGLHVDWDHQSKNSLTAGAIIGILIGIAGIVTAVAGGIIRGKHHGCQSRITTPTVVFIKDQQQRKSNRSQVSMQSNASASSANSGDGLTKHVG